MRAAATLRDRLSALHGHGVILFDALPALQDRPVKLVSDLPVLRSHRVKLSNGPPVFDALRSTLRDVRRVPYERPSIVVRRVAVSKFHPSVLIVSARTDSAVSSS